MLIFLLTFQPLSAELDAGSLMQTDRLPRQKLKTFLVYGEAQQTRRLIV
jgi:hypothetical protein